MFGFVRAKRLRDLERLHAHHFRVGAIWKPHSQKLTARLRMIDPSIRVEEDHEKYVVYAGRQLDVGEIAAVKAEILQRFDGT